MAWRLSNAQDDVTAMSVGKNGDILFSGFVSGVVRYSQGRFVTLASKTVLHSPDHFDGGNGRRQSLDGPREKQAFTASATDESLPSPGEYQTKRSIPCWRPIANCGSVPITGSFTGMERRFPRLASLTLLTASTHLQRSGTATQTSGLAHPLGSYGSMPEGFSSLERDVNRSSGFVTSLFEDREGNLWVGNYTRD